MLFPRINTKSSIFTQVLVFMSEKKSYIKKKNQIFCFFYAFNYNN